MVRLLLKAKINIEVVIVMPTYAPIRKFFLKLFFLNFFIGNGFKSEWKSYRLT